MLQRNDICRDGNYSIQVIFEADAANRSSAGRQIFPIGGSWRCIFLNPPSRLYYRLVLVVKSYYGIYVNIML